MKRIILVLLIASAAIVPFVVFKNMTCPLSLPKENLTCSIDLKICQKNILKYLKLRKDNLASGEIEKILAIQPDDVCALWGKAEILRRAYKFQDSERLLNQVLAQCPGHAPSLISLAYIKYHDNKLQDASRLLKQALKQPGLGREDRALIYMLMGSINAKKATQGGLLSKIAYGRRIRGFFERAKACAPDLTEVRLGLGSFYLLAPKITGGDVDRAIEELEYAVKLTPDFATANIRLAQAYKQKGNLEKYNFYIQRTKEIDPENEVLKKIEDQL